MPHLKKENDLVVTNNISKGYVSIVYDESLLKIKEKSAFYRIQLECKKYTLTNIKNIPSVIGDK
jgi:hypothetical protein